MLIRYKMFKNYPFSVEYSDVIVIYHQVIIQAQKLCVDGM